MKREMVEKLEERARGHPELRGIPPQISEINRISLGLARLCQVDETSIPDSLIEDFRSYQMVVFSQFAEMPDSVAVISILVASILRLNERISNLTVSERE